MTRKEMEARRLEAAKELSCPSGDLVQKYGISRTTLSRWRRRLRAEGVGGLQLRKPSGRPTRLTEDQKKQVREMWHSRTDWTSRTFAEAIREVTGIRYDPDHVSRIVIRMGLREKRPYPARRKAA